MSAPKRGPGRPSRTSTRWPDWPTFVGEGETWLLRQVMFDSALPPHAPRVGNAIRMSVNFTSGVAEVGVGKIAAVLGLSDDTVTRCIAALNDRGHITLAAGRGRGNVHRIGWLLKAETRTGNFVGLTLENITGLSGKAAERLREMMGDENTAGLRSFADENTANMRGFLQENPADEDGKPRKEDRKTPQPCGTYLPSNDLSNDHGGKPPYPRGQAADPKEFSDAEPAASPFNAAGPYPARRSEEQLIDGEVLTPGEADDLLAWLLEAWPKKRPPALAAAALEAVLLAGADPEEIEAGARAYLAERAADRRGGAAQVRFCAALDRWLTDRRWLDHTAAPAAAAGGGGDLGNGMSLNELIAAFGGGSL